MNIAGKGRPKLHSFTKVTCLDSIMIEMLECVPDLMMPPTSHYLRTLRNFNQRGSVYTFGSGASLLVGDMPNEFFIYCLFIDGSDVTSAKEELKMLEALRKAKKHFSAMKKACYNPRMDALVLRATCL